MDWDKEKLGCYLSLESSWQVEIKIYQNFQVKKVSIYTFRFKS